MAQRIILAGGGHAHLAVLADWAKRPAPGAERVLISPARHTHYSGMLPGWIAGIYHAEDFAIDLAALAERAGARLVIDAVAGLDADRRQLRLASGEAMGFDILSLAIGGEEDLSGLVEIRSQLLSVRPFARFIQQWPRVVAAAARTSGLTIAVVGGGAAGVEIAFAAKAALARHGARITLVAPPGALMPGHGDAARRVAARELARREITVRFGVSSGGPEGLKLSDGSVVDADFVIAATGSRTPAWLAHSGLATTSDGFVAIGADLQSMSHKGIFAAGDVALSAERPWPRSGVHAVKSGPVLAANLRAVVANEPVRHYQPARRTLALLATGDRRAIASWGRFACSGRWVWWAKDRIDGRFVARQRV